MVQVAGGRKIGEREGMTVGMKGREGGEGRAERQSGGKGRKGGKEAEIRQRWPSVDLKIVQHNLQQSTFVPMPLRLSPLVLVTTSRSNMF